MVQKFQSAPVSRRIIVRAIATFGFLFAVGVFDARFVFLHANALGKDHGRWIAPLFSVGGIFVVACSLLIDRARMEFITIEDDYLVVAKKRFRLTGVTGAERDPLVLKGARRTWGSSGLGAITGHFVSRRLGKFRAFITAPENAVIIRWPNQAVVVSPADPEFFITSIMDALRRGNRAVS